MKDKYKSEAMRVIHEDMEGMHQLGVINDVRMKEFDKMYLVQKSEAVHAVLTLEIKYVTA
jgi:DNA-binding transcriptional regulator YiaG